MKIRGSIFPILYTIIAISGMLICLALAFQYHMSKVLRNHCRVYEFWPSVSAVIGDYSPEVNVWRCAIGLSSGPRIAQTLMISHYFSTRLPDYKNLRNLVVVSDTIRIVSAGMWTYVTSSDHLIIHEVFYVVYIVFSLVFMGVHYYLFKKITPIAKTQDPSDSFLKSLRWKKWCLIIQGSMFALSLYFFIYEHQMHCMKAAYSKYSLCEWVLAAANILYDTSFYLDFKDTYYTLSSEEKDK